MPQEQEHGAVGRYGTLREILPRDTSPGTPARPVELDVGGVDRACNDLPACLGTACIGSARVECRPPSQGYAKTAHVPCTAAFSASLASATLVVKRAPDRTGSPSF